MTLNHNSYQITSHPNADQTYDRNPFVLAARDYRAKHEEHHLSREKVVAATAGAVALATLISIAVHNMPDTSNTPPTPPREVPVRAVVKGMPSQCEDQFVIPTDLLPLTKSQSAAAESTPTPEQSGCN